MIIEERTRTRYTLFKSLGQKLNIRDLLLKGNRENNIYPKPTKIFVSIESISASLQFKETLEEKINVFVFNAWCLTN